MVAMFVILTITVFVLLDLVIQAQERRVKGAEEAAPEHAAAEVVRKRIPPVDAYNLPRGLFYHRGHTWVHQLMSGEARVGIDDFIQSVMGRINRIVLPKAGTVVQEGERIFSVVLDGRTVDFLSPIDGIVSGVNDRLADAGEILKKSPYGEGWVLEVKPRNIVENLKAMRSGPQAFDWLRGELARFSEFIAASMTLPQEVGVTIQDGGHYYAGVVEKMDDRLLGLFIQRFLR